MEESIFDLADQLVALREEKAKLEERVKRLGGFIDEIDYKLSEAMALAETQNFTRAGHTFYLTTKTRASAVADQKDKLYAQLREHGFGDLIYETVNANSLSSFVKEQMEEKAETLCGGDAYGDSDCLPEWLVGLVNVYDKTSVGVRKSAK